MTIRLLIISDCYPNDLTSGKHLRVHNLCKILCSEFECYFVGLSEGVKPNKIKFPLPFQEIVSFEKRVRKKLPWWRLFRLSDAHYVSESSPDFCTKSIDRIHELADKWNIDATVTFEPTLAEITMSLDIPRILDYSDCGTLTVERRLANRSSRSSLLEFFRTHLKRLRSMNRERHILPNFNRIITISEQDRARMIEVSRVDDARICVIPNGVSISALGNAESGKVRKNSVVFWGNLDFPPNSTAVSYFYEMVFLPYLADKGIEWHIVGAGAGEEINKMSEHRQIILAGFQQNLAGYVSGMGAMVNPMVEGSGLKNKVLEAFAMGLPVISTKIGAEAIDCCAGQHFLVGDTPEQFAEQLLRVLEDDELSKSLVINAKELVLQKYDWSAIGREYATAVQNILGR